MRQGSTNVKNVTPIILLESTANVEDKVPSNIKWGMSHDSLHNVGKQGRRGRQERVDEIGANGPNGTAGFMYVGARKPGGAGITADVFPTYVIIGAEKDSSERRVENFDRHIFHCG